MKKQTIAIKEYTEAIESQTKAMNRAFDVTIAFAQSANATPAQIIDLHKDLFFIYAYGMTFKEYQSKNG